MKKTLVALALLVLFGCGEQKVTGHDEGSLLSSIERMESALEGDKKARFHESMTAISRKVFDAHPSIDGKEAEGRYVKAYIAEVGGKTADEIIEYGEKIITESQEAERSKVLNETPEPEEKQVGAREAEAAVAGGKWLERKSVDQVTDEEIHLISLRSENSAEFDFPYNVEGGSKLRVVFRKTGGELDAMLIIDKGQMLCSALDCGFALRIDDGKAQRWTGVGAASHDSEMMFVRDARQLESIVKQADKIRIGIEFYRAGMMAFDFDVAGYQGFE